MLDHFGTTEASWRDACRMAPGFAISESPAYAARGVAALAADLDHARFAGRTLISRDLADTYAVTDADGSRPDCWGHIAAHGMGNEDPTTIARFR